MNDERDVPVDPVRGEQEHSREPENPGRESFEQRSSKKKRERPERRPLSDFSDDELERERERLEQAWSKNPHVKRELDRVDAVLQKRARERTVVAQEPRPAEEAKGVPGVVATPEGASEEGPVIPTPGPLSEAEKLARPDAGEVWRSLHPPAAGEEWQKPPVPTKGEGVSGAQPTLAGPVAEGAEEAAPATGESGQSVSDPQEEVETTKRVPGEPEGEPSGEERSPDETPEPPPVPKGAGQEEATPGAPETPKASVEPQEFSQEQAGPSPEEHEASQPSPETPPVDEERQREVVYFQDVVAEILQDPPRGLDDQSEAIKTLRACQQAVERGDGTILAKSETWWALANVNTAKVEEGDHVRAPAELAEAYGNFVEHDGFHKYPGRDSHILALIAMRESPDAALQIFTKLSDSLDRHGMVVREGEKQRSASEVTADLWYDDLRRNVEHLEQTIRPEDIDDPEFLAEKKKILEQPLDKESFPAHIQALSAMIGELEADQWAARRRREREPEGEPGEVKKTPEQLRRERTGESRQRYAEALMSQGRIFGRASPEQLEQLRTGYQTAVEEEVRTGVEDIKREFGARDRTNPTVEADLNARITELVLGSRQEETNALRDAMRQGPERSAVQRFKKFWKRHPWMRMAVGYSLMVGSGVALTTGNVPLAGLFLGTRSALAGIGTTITTEGAWQILREASGETRELKKEDIEDEETMSDEELERRLAAHTTMYSEKGGVFGERAVPMMQDPRRVGLRRMIGVQTDETGRLVEAELRRRQEAKMRGEITRLHSEGKSTDEIIEGALTSSLEQQRGTHRALESRRAVDRRNSVKKWITAGGLGLVIGGLTGGLGLARMQQALDAVEAKQATARAGKAGLEAARAGLGAPPESAVAPPPPIPEATPGAPPVEVPTPTPEAPVTEAAPGTTPAVGVPPTPEVPPVVEQPSTVPETPAVSDTAPEAPAQPSPELAGPPGAEEAPAAEAAPEVAPGAATEAPIHVDAVETAKKGDSIWKMGGRQLEERFGDRFTGLDEARKTYMIDAIKDKVAEHPEAFGLQDIDDLRLDQPVDFTPAFEGKDAVPIEEVFGKAKELPESAVQNILENNAKLDAWVDSHPGEHLTSEKVQEILSTGARAATEGAVQGAQVPAIDDGWARRVAAGARERFLDRVCETDPARYLELHKQYPDLYPERPGVTDQIILAGEAEAHVDHEATGHEHGAHIHEHAPETVQATIELSGRGARAMKELSQTTAGLMREMPADQAKNITDSVNTMEVSAALKKGAIEKLVDRLEGGTEDVAKSIGKAVRDLLKAIPKKAILEGERVGSVLGRVKGP